MNYCKKNSITFSINFTITFFIADCNSNRNRDIGIKYIIKNLTQLLWAPV